MGNRLFHYHFLRQVSKKTGINYFNIHFPESKYFEEFNTHKRKFSLFRKQIKLSSQEVRKIDPDDFLKFVKAKNEASYDIIFKPPFLGEIFFDYIFYPPSDFIKIKKEYQKTFNFEIENKILVGLHFRGTDFETWNSKASLKPEYYQAAIQSCLSEPENERLVFVLFTDDLNFKTYLETIDYLKKENLEFYLSDRFNFPISDFYHITQGDIVISSPSTFAILAACLGRSKKIIHSRDWLDYAVSNNDKFWVDLIKSKSPYYSLWKSL